MAGLGSGMHPVAAQETQDWRSDTQPLTPPLVSPVTKAICNCGQILRIRENRIKFLVSKCITRGTKHSTFLCNQAPFQLFCFLSCEANAKGNAFMLGNNPQGYTSELSCLKINSIWEKPPAVSYKVAGETDPKPQGFGLFLFLSKPSAFSPF